MTYKNFSKRQLIAMTWWNRPRFEGFDGILCDGAVRSGKTVSITLGFFLWSMSRFDNEVFALGGKTIGALQRNILQNLPKWLGGVFRFRFSKRGVAGRGGDFESCLFRAGLRPMLRGGGETVVFLQSPGT